MSSVPASLLNAALLARPQAERDRILIDTVNRDHLPGVVAALNRLSHAYGGDGLKITPQTEPTIASPVTTAIAADDILEIKLHARAFSNKTLTGIENKKDNLLFATVPIFLTAPMRAGIEAALGLRPMPVVGESLAQKETPVTPELRAIIRKGVLAAGRKIDMLDISAVTDGHGNRYFDFTTKYKPGPMQLIQHPDPNKGAADPNDLYVTVHAVTSFGIEQRCHVFTVTPEGTLQPKREYIIGIGV